MSIDVVKVGRGLSVNQRLLTLGVAAFAGFAAMIGAGWYQNSKASSALTYAQETRDEVAIVNQLRMANVEMVLAAMDAIVDRDDRKVAPERLETMKTSIAAMRDNADTVKALAGSIGKSDLPATYLSDIEAVEKSVLGELPGLIEAGADPAEFVKIDDAIDGAGDRISSLYATLTGDGKKIADAAAADALYQSQ